MKMVVEPTGCLSFAGACKALEANPPAKGERIGVIVSGGNVDLGALRGAAGTALNRRKGRGCVRLYPGRLAPP